MYVRIPLHQELESPLLRLPPLLPVSLVRGQLEGERHRRRATHQAPDDERALNL